MYNNCRLTEEIMSETLRDSPVFAPLDAFLEAFDLDFRLLSGSEKINFSAGLRNFGY